MSGEHYIKEALAEVHEKIQKAASTRPDVRLSHNFTVLSSTHYSDFFPTAFTIHNSKTSGCEQNQTYRDDSRSIQTR